MNALEETAASAIGRDRKYSACPAQQHTLLGLDARFAFPCHADSRHDKEESEQDQNPFETYQRAPDADKDRAEDHGSQDAVKQNLVLVFRRNREVAEDEREYEHVVDGERLLDYITGQKFQAEPAGGIRRNVPGCKQVQ